MVITILKGNMLEMKASRDKRVIDKIQALAAEYGDMVHLHLGMRDDLVILSSTDVSNYIYDVFIRIKNIVKYKNNNY